MTCVLLISALPFRYKKVLIINMRVTPSSNLFIWRRGLAASNRTTKIRILKQFEQFEQYCIANGIDNDKSAIFCTIMGHNTFLLLRNLLSPVKHKDKNFKEQLSVLKNHFAPKPLIIAERFRFYRQSQEDSESIGEYLAKLRRMVEDCKFGSFLNEAIRDQLVCGIKNERSQRQLLGESDLTLETAFQKAQAMEKTDRNIHEMRKQEVKYNQTGKNIWDKQRIRTIRSVPDAAKNTVLQITAGLKMPHADDVASLVILNGFISKRRLLYTKIKRERLNAIYKQLALREDNENEYVDYVYLAMDCKKPKFVHVSVNGRIIPMELDTGATTIIISETTWKEIGKENWRL